MKNLNFNYYLSLALLIFMPLTSMFADITITADVFNPYCGSGNQGSINLSLEGGVAPYNVAWDDSALEGTYIWSLATGDYTVTVTDANNDTATETFTVVEQEILTAPVWECMDNDEVLLVVYIWTDVAVPYTLQWSNGETTTTAEVFDPGGINDEYSYGEIRAPDNTDYSVTITDVDGVCTKVLNYTGIDAACNGIVIDADITNTSCHGSEDGAIDVTVVGGSEVYTYEWSNNTQSEDLIDLTVGTYNLTVTDSEGIQNTASFTVGKDSLYTTYSYDCNQAGADEAEVTILVWNNDNPPYSIVLNDGVNVSTIDDVDQTTTIVLSALSDYTVTITDADETCTHVFGIDIDCELGISSSNVINAQCGNASGSAIDINVIGGFAPYSYAWTGPNGFTSNQEDLSGVEPGEYTVVLTDANDNTYSEVFTVGEDGLLVAASYECIIGGVSEEANVTAIVWNPTNPPYTYSWSNGIVVTGAQVSTNGSDSYNQAVISLTPNGTYSVTVTDASGDCQEVIEINVECTDTPPTNELEECHSFVISNTSTAPGETICVDVRAYGFEDNNVNLISFQHTLGWDENELEFVNIQNELSGLTINDLFANTGLLPISWFELTGTGISIDDGDLLYQACFTIIENGSIVEFADELTEREVTIKENGSAQFIIDVNYVNGSVSVSDVPPPINLVHTCVQDADCDASVLGSIDVAFEMAGAYTYTWGSSNGFNSTDEDITDLAAGTYNLTVTDGGNAEVYTFVVGGGTQLIANITTTAIECNNPNSGAIDLELVAGDYTIEWSDGSMDEDRTGLAPGDYVVTVTNANNCQDIATVTLEENSLIAATSYNLLCIEDVMITGDITAVLWTEISDTEPATYTWSTGFSETTTNNTSKLLNVPSGTYSVTITSFSGCEWVSDDIIIPGVVEEPEDVFICEGDAVTLNVNADNASSYLWTPSVGLSCEECPNPTAIVSQTTTYAVTMVFEDPNCTLTEEITIYIDDDCVWPGDTDTNKVVNNFDLLNIGLAYGTQGPVRPNASIQWLAQYADNWNESTPNSNVNYKHIDTDGNGTINSDDTLAIINNWGQMHNLLPGNVTNLSPLPPNESSTVMVPITVGTDVVEQGTSISLPIFLGDMNLPVEDAYGLAFTIVYDPEIVVPGSGKVHLIDSWFGTIDDDMIGIHKGFADHIDVGLTRIDGVNVTGGGTIGQLHITIKDDILFNSSTTREDELDLLIRVENVRLITKAEEDILVQGIPSITTVVETIVNTNNPILDQYIKVHPNPVRNDVNIEVKELHLEGVQLYSLHGKLLSHVDAETNRIQLDMRQLAQGTYLVKVLTKEGTITQKMIVLK